MVQDAEASNPARICAFYFALAFIFVRFSMIHEAIAFRYGVNTYLLYIFGPPALVGMLMSGGLRRAFRTNATRLALGFILWMVAACPFSAWKGGSIQFALVYVRTEVAILFLIAGLVTSWKECVAVANTIAAAALVGVGLSRMFALQIDGRFSLSMVGSTISNSNDYAAHLILVLGFLLGFAMRRGLALRLAFGGVIAYGLFVILSTASRGALLALVCIGIYVLVYATPSQRVLAGVGLFVGGVLLFSILPPDTKSRLTSFSTDKNDEASESALSRRYLLEQAIRFTIHNPVFGVGPGQFASYEGGVSTEEGRRGNWHEAHNSYAQVAAECGVPALGLFLGALVSAYRLLSRTFRKSQTFGRDAREIRIVTFCSLIGVFGFCVAIAFLNFYPKFYLLAIVSYAAAVASAAEGEFQRIQSAQQQRVMAASTSALAQPRIGRQIASAARLRVT